MSKQTPVEFLAERYNYITWMRNRDEISAGTADEWRSKFLKEAKEMEKKQLIELVKFTAGELSTPNTLSNEDAESILDDFLDSEQTTSTNNEVDCFKNLPHE